MDLFVRRPSPSRALCVLWLALAGLALVGCNRRTRMSPPPGTLRVSLGVSALRISLPVFVAMHDSIFRAHGLDVELHPYPTAQPMMDDLALGRLDAAGYVAFPIALLASSRARMPLRVATTLVEDATHRLSYVLAARASGLHFPADAGGKRIGILPTVAYRRWLLALLAAAQVDIRSVTIVPLDPSFQADALRTHGVDLLFTNDPVATAILRSQVGEIVDDGPPCALRLGSPFVFGTFALGRDFVVQHPAVARRLVDALDEAIARIEGDQTSARHAMLPFVRPEDRASVDAYPPARYLPSSHLDARALGAEIQHERDLGILDRTPRVLAWPVVPQP